MEDKKKSFARIVPENYRIMTDYNSQIKKLGTANDINKANDTIKRKRKNPKNKKYI